MIIKPDAKIYVAGHRGLVGSALVRAQGYHNLVLRAHAELDLLDQAATARFFAETRPEVVFLAAARDNRWMQCMALYPPRRGLV